MHSELIHFIVEAKKAAYASGSGGTNEATRRGAKDISYQKGHYSYLDSYYGEIDFIGQEVIWCDQKAVWGMNYHGVTYDPVHGFPEFLIDALKLVPNDAPYRGPKHYSNDTFEYYCEWFGEVDDFKGREVVTHEGKEIFVLKFHGGKINYK